MPNTRPARDILDAEVVRYKRYVEKKTLEQVALELGCSTMSLCRFCKDSGIDNPHLEKKLVLDLTGRQFGFMKVLRQVPGKRSHCGCLIWECQCTHKQCGKILERASNTLMHGRRMNQSCGCYIRSHNYRGIEDLSGCYFNQIRGGAKERDLDFAITKEYAWQLFVDQGKRCALTGRSIELVPNLRRMKNRCQTASLDRIDSSQGYIVGNLQWIHKSLQFLKSDLPQADFIQLCHEVATCHPLPQVARLSEASPPS